MNMADGRTNKAGKIGYFPSEERRVENVMFVIENNAAFLEL